MKSLNVVLVALSVGLECALLGVLIVRGNARRLSLFTLLIAFYVARSVAYLVLPAHMGPASFARLFAGLSLADVVLELGLAGQIALAAARQYSDAQRDRLSRVLLLLLAGVLVSVLATALLPSRGRVQIDRGTVLVGFLMLLLWVWMAVERLGGPARRVAEGFAAYGAVAIVANVVRNQAGLHRNETLFRTASYAQSGAYLLAVAFWCLALRRAGPAVASPEREQVRA
jgi:hypothetical protein